MGKIFLFSIRRMIRQRCAVWFFLMIGMTLLSFCISVILGFVSRSYFNETQFGANASLAVWYGENGSNQEDIQQLLESKISEQAENILFISKDKNMRLIGWKGFGIDQWFPHSTGRFFSEEEEKDGEMVAYIHHDKYDALNRNMKYEGENYHIVGAGFLEAWNIYSPISNESPQTLFSMDNMELEIVLFPYTTYLMRKNPELVLIHFPNSTYSELKRRKEQLENVAQRIRGLGGEVLVVTSDISKKEDCKNVIDETIKTFGKLDILVNNAGVLDHALLPIEAVDENDVNFKLMRTELLRNRNRLLDSLKAANEYISSVI